MAQPKWAKAVKAEMKLSSAGPSKVVKAASKGKPGMKAGKKLGKGMVL